MTKPPRFRVIQGTPAPDTPVEQVRKRIRPMAKPPAMIQCHRCGGREVIETKTGVVFRDGKYSAGTKQYLCVSCLLRGERVLIA